MLETLINGDPNWLLLTTEINLRNLVVTNGGQVALNDLSQVMLIDRDLIEHDLDAKEEKENKEECDFHCLEKVSF